MIQQGVGSRLLQKIGQFLKERENKRLLQGRQKLINGIHRMRMRCPLQKVEFDQTFHLRIQADIPLTLFDTGRTFSWVNLRTECG